MKRERFSKLATFLLVLWLAFMPSQACAVPQTFADEYIGGTPTSPAWNGADVIGNPNYFGVNDITIDVADGVVSVAISANYFDNVGMYGTELGDLFIRITPLTEPTVDRWHFAVVLDNHGEELLNNPGSMEGQGGQVALYNVNQSRVIDSYAPAGYVYRAGQAVQYNTEGLGQADVLSTGTWSITNNSLVITFASIFEPDAYLDFHWTETCGNDVIQTRAYRTIVPEPASVALLILGLAGIGGRRRRR